MLTTGWGRYPSIDAHWLTFDNEEQLRRTLDNIDPAAHAIPRGLGRSYGDSSLSENLLSTRRLDRFISFEDSTGELICESGVSLAEILDTFVPRGWFVPVTPGTRFVTVGGAIASDVHGKNHHREGSFSNHVEWLDLLLADGNVVRCSRTENTELFLSTCAGYGLTGIVIRAAIRLRKIDTAFIRQKIVKTKNLEETLAAFDEHAGWTYSVAWIDTLRGGAAMGRSVLMLGDHATREDVPGNAEPLKPVRSRRLAVPFDFPGFVLGSVSVRAFNFAYYTKSSSRENVIPYQPFFYPLDSIRDWNRIYGRRGFVQYQFVIEKESGKEGLKDILTRTAKGVSGSFLAVLKLFGKEDPPYLSFAKEGYTLALDFPVTSGLWKELDELDALVKDHGGRIYPAKDARMRPAMFRSGYAQLDKFLQTREKVDPGRRFSSLQSRRLEL
ncbi:MAG: FAD-binding oxidoreductase [Bacteroidetes bacterium]|nr:FAD-binding oxidoreductase [Bacteroidota bacterium]